jgi:cell pole-organizing protein PopZ
MAADKTPDQEPSIEEILASIRQIISDDDDKEGVAEEPVVQAPPPAPPPPPPPKPKEPEPVIEEPEEEEEEDVLELTESMAEPLPIEEGEVSIDLQEMPEEAPPVPVEVEMESPKNIGMSDILTETARAATISSMAKLAGNMPITRHRDYGNITLEDLVREMLHPMLKDWLSDNLPPMVERMVQKELEKLARQAQDV